MARFVVVGSGVFGVTGAIALADRGHAVTLVDPGPLPHPDAASTDLSKIVRADYGDDLLYTELAERSIEGWLAWNREFREELFRPVGLAVLCRGPLAERPAEHASYRLLRDRGHAPERLDAGEIERRFPLWRPRFFTDGYLSPRAGWVASGRAIARLVERARARGVEVLTGTGASPLPQAPGPLGGVRLTDGRWLPADGVVLAAGAWTPSLHPALADRLWATAQPVLLVAPPDPERFTPPQFPVFAADISRDGWYGFPVAEDGVLKIANHGTGRRVDASVGRALEPGAEARARAFLADALPDAADAPRVGGRTCLYCDSFDGDFWLDRDPERPDLVVAAGGSGHAFKFAPLLGEILAETCERDLPRELARWRWRARGSRATDVLRAHG